MSDGHMMAGVVDAPINGGATEKETVDSSSTGESVASQNEGQAGDSQESPEVGSEREQNVRQRGPSKMDTIRQLRQERREMRSYWESEVGQLKAQIEELKKGIGSGHQTQKPSKTFWEAPEEIIDERLGSRLSEMEKRLLERFEQRESQNQQSTEWKQETSEAEKFILDQKGLTPDDHEDIAEIIRATPSMQNLRPMERAKYAYFLWKEERGITDRSASKARAATSSGAPPAQGGVKTWTETEIRAEMDKFPQNPANWSKEDEARFKSLDDEIRRAYRENRVKK